MSVDVGFVAERALMMLVTVIVVVRMIYVGYLAPFGRIMSWPMFAYGNYVDVSVTVSDGTTERPVNIFELLPQGEYTIGLRELQFIVDYLARDGGVVTVVGTFTNRHGVHPIRIEDGRVVV